VWREAGLAGALALSVALDTGPDPRRDHAARAALEATLAGGHVAWHNAGYLGLGVTDAGGWFPAQVGVRSEVVVDAHRFVQPVAQVSVVSVIAGFRDRTQLAVGAGTVEVAAGLTIPVIGDNLRVQLDGYWDRRIWPDRITDAGGVRGMVQAGF
jgi:hypothetical protein